MQRQDGISVGCSSFYSKLFNNKLWFSNLDHSVGVALIVWHFTKDKKQTLAGLFHDISTPAFSHILDFMHGDYLNQESTEDLTKYMIENSKEIMELLKRDEIKVEEVCDYHMYPIADNDTPMLSADRLEYTFSDGLEIDGIFDLDKVNKIYKNISVLKNENDEIELGFNNLNIAEEFIFNANKLWLLISGGNEVNFIMQFWTDYLKESMKKGYIQEADLYKMSEFEIIEKIKKQADKKMVDILGVFQNSTEIERSDIEVKDKYCVSIKAKKRYINPLVENDNILKRVTDLSDEAKKIIEDIKVFEDSKFSYLNFDF